MSVPAIEDRDLILGQTCHIEVCPALKLGGLSSGHEKSLTDQNLSGFFNSLAERTGLEPATPGVTGRYSNQLNYRSAAVAKQKLWRPLGDSNPCTHRERVVS